MEGYRCKKVSWKDRSAGRLVEGYAGNPTRVEGVRVEGLKGRLDKVEGSME